jgi:hypothetical protein
MADDIVTLKFNKDAFSFVLKPSPYTLGRGEIIRVENLSNVGDFWLDLPHIDIQHSLEEITHDPPHL